MPGIVDWVQHGSPGERQTKIIDVLVDAFSELMAADPDAFRNKFRKMAADPFAFYRVDPGLHKLGSTYLYLLALHRSQKQSLWQHDYGCQ